jgi:hypothetical protein
MPKKYTITLDHIEAAAKWAIRARKAKKAIKIDGVKRVFGMSRYECGTACCIAGAAALIAGVPVLRVPTVAYDLHAALDGWGCRSAIVPCAGTDAAGDIAEAMNAEVPESKAPERVLKACAAVRKELAKKKGAK